MEKDLNKNTKTKPKYVINYKKFVPFILVTLLIVILGIIIISSNTKAKITEDTNISKLSGKKYYEEILAKYNEDGMSEKFLNDYDTVQTAVGMYMINNMTNEDGSVDELLQNIRADFSKDTFEYLEIEKPTTWNGQWSVTDEGVVKFKFLDKLVEPNWVSDSKISNKVILN